MNNAKRYIAHFDLDSFFVSVELLLKPELKGKPVIVGGSVARGVVSTCSYEARKYGIHSAMPMARAMKLCPQAIVLKGNYREYGSWSKKVTEIIASKVPLYQKASIDEFYCDLTGMERYFDISNYVRQMREEIIKETGLPISCGLSSAKYISKIATNEAKPNGFLQVPHGRETAFLWPLDIEKINGIGKQTEQHLRAMGINIIQDLAQTSVEILENKLGKWGRDLWQKAQGKAGAELETEWQQKSMSRETTFHKNHTDKEFLHARLVSLTERTAYDLRQGEKLTGCVAVKIRYDNFETTNKQETLPYTSLDDELIEKTKSLFNKLYQRGRAVRLIGVRFSQLTDSGMQMNLFGNKDMRLNLYKAMDGIKNRFGDQFISKAVATQKK